MSICINIITFFILFEFLLLNLPPVIYVPEDVLRECNISFVSFQMNSVLYANSKETVDYSRIENVVTMPKI